jgi:hypothetical protein
MNQLQMLLARIAKQNPDHLSLFGATAIPHSNYAVGILDVCAGRVFGMSLSRRSHPKERPPENRRGEG